MKEPHFNEKKTSLIIITNKHNITDYILNQQKRIFYTNQHQGVPTKNAENSVK